MYIYFQYVWVEKDPVIQVHSLHYERNLTEGKNLFETLTLV